ncbi:hypothetical protein [Streptomyces sp. NPDC014623]|uniref:hypothetical protein n=1 Tax=Streptomyces sp. NPDC014623 TaxID=3364875 RepID=UPI003700191D
MTTGSTAGLAAAPEEVGQRAAVTAPSGRTARVAAALTARRATAWRMPARRRAVRLVDARLMGIRGRTGGGGP